MSDTRKLAVGWFDNADFKAACEKYVPRIKEIFFAWPGVTACRPMDPWTPERRERIVADLRWARENGIELDAIFNANCYGDISMTETLADHVTEKLREMDSAGLMPEHLTTASPFIATVVRRRFPAIKIRWSINMFLDTVDSLGYVEDLFDSFYAGRNSIRDRAFLKGMSDWAKAHGKEVGIQANAGCLRNCTYHTFHDNLHGHDRMGQSAAAAKFGFSNFLCRTHYEKGNEWDFLRATWIRPEDLPLYEPLVSVVKLATRRHPDPAAVIKAYAECRYDGDLCAITDPFFRFPRPIDNAKLGASPIWPKLRECLDIEESTRLAKALLSELWGPNAPGSPPRKSEDAAFDQFFKG